ncbi:P. aerophilum family 322 protein part 2, authentic frameshift [Pyrobaculum aerophilum str. IM2]|uniref:P. aerophilum family 322 protein part 2, authentic frameshift n=3 Tax=Pyrobaculum aerophilum TaxID=13773 RepID=Q8ZX66_PYRAE|nr:hypothetical protein [Pyrobaculum aerophilum]AAL63483.1 P. aerophilum family 322 protein part 2, authentic frameshift [Pyrobaculum aerophilum str. IM2]
MSFLHTWAYLKYGVWGAAFLHGAVNGWAGAYFLLYPHTFGDVVWSITGLYGAATLTVTTAAFWLLATLVARATKIENLLTSVENKSLDIRLKRA